MTNSIALKRSSMNASNRIRSVILTGASTRSLAASAVGAGYIPYCVDLFCDSDLKWLLKQNGAEPPIQISSFADLPEALSHVPPHLPVVWTGGLENSPDVIRAISERHHVLGPSIGTIEYVSNPLHLQTLVDGTTCRTPEIAMAEEADVGKDWLVKPLHSAGGIGIRHLQHGDSCHETEFLQCYVHGLPISALYCHGTTGTELLSTSIQLTGVENLGGSAFAFCGNIGPISFPDRVTQALLEAGQNIAAAGMIGVFGADFVVTDDGVWLIEVNPRITASHELHDFIHAGPTVLDRHIAGCLNEPVNRNLTRRGIHQSACLARLIVYAAGDVDVEERDIQELGRFHQALGCRIEPPRPHATRDSWVSDIPTPSRISVGDPFCSVYHLLHQDHNGKFTGPNISDSAQIDSLVARYTKLHSLDTIMTARQWLSRLDSDLMRDATVDSQQK